MAALVAGASVAGWIDAVVGGGGLVLIPILLITLPGLAPVKALGTNKVAALWGTATAAFIYIRRNGVDWRLGGVAIPLAALGASCGALLASAVNSDLLRPVVIVLMIGVGIFIVRAPEFGSGDTAGVGPGTVRTAMAIALFPVIGLYDGLFGPGTGMFLIMSLAAILARDFLSSATLAKVVNTATNIGALIVFSLQGNVLWALGLVLAVANIFGSIVGSRMVLNNGTKFIRYALLAIVVVMGTKLSIDQYLSL
ncbi:TSUP family transporter [Nocardia sp. CNY236]|uniref:TSUP family transporter n=1 Tax=Nocardia sp. CNY236 TaxID=1169152 RepID=UPI00048D2E8C|nr:TSUP family transporter [Nocardia sp. CNY236]